MSHKSPAHHSPIGQSPPGPNPRYPDQRRFLITEALRGRNVGGILTLSKTSKEDFVKALGYRSGGRRHPIHVFRGGGGTTASAEGWGHRVGATHSEWMMGFKFGC